MVTDSEVNRVWAPPDSKRTNITYFAPTDSARRRMESYGVPRSRIRVTGYPLPGELVGHDRAALKRNFRARMERIGRQGKPPLVVFAVGGAGAQVPLAKAVIRGMKKQVLDGSLRLAVVAGRRPDVASALSNALSTHGLIGHAGAELLYDRDVFSYFRRFNELLARADVLWSKPSELTFFAGLGLPFIAAPRSRSTTRRSLATGCSNGSRTAFWPARRRRACACRKWASTRSPTRWRTPDFPRAGAVPGIEAPPWIWPSSTTSCPRT